MAKSFHEYQAEKREREWSDRVKSQKEAMGNADRVKRATEWKRIGNEKFKSGNLLEALDYYREAVVFVEDLVDARRQERTELLMPLYCNLAQVHLKQGEASKAEEVCGKAITIAEVPRNGVAGGMHAKALFRRGVARKALGKLDESRHDLSAAIKLQPDSEEISSALASLRSELAAENKRAREAMGGFLNKAAAPDSEAKRKAEEKEKAKEKLRLAEERRQARLAKAEQRQQMQAAFDKLSKGSMLYEKREQEMEPVRKKEEEKRNTLELEQKLLNIIGESKGVSKVENFDEFLDQKKERCKEQNSELEQKKKILDKQQKEQQWEQDDVWRGQRDDHRRRLEEDRASGSGASAPSSSSRSFWEAKEVARWCEQRLRDLLLRASTVPAGGQPLAPALVREVLGSKAASGGDDDRPPRHALKAIITDVLKLEGDAAVVRLNPHKPPLFYFDYFLKLDWEVAIVQEGGSAYRTAEELILSAAEAETGKAPASVSENRVLAGTFKVRELCSEEAPAEGSEWPLLTKVKDRRECSADLRRLSEELRDSLRGLVNQLLIQWAAEYRAHWS